MSNSSVSSNCQEDSSNSTNENRENPTVIEPEFVLIDERAETERYTYFGVDAIKRPLDSLEDEKGSANTDSLKSLPLRLICFFCLILAVLFGSFMIFLSFLATVLATLNLFQNHSLNHELKKNWKTCVHTLVACFGFILGIISPTLGLGLLALYFSIVGKLADDSVLRRVIRGAFNHF